jgi:pimeloyl-ACP methyl ester carboxylesterase
MPEVVIPYGNLELTGELVVPTGAMGVVVFVHGAGSSRNSPRNRYVASAFQGARMGTLLFDLHTEREAAAADVSRQYRFDVRLLGDRLISTLDWLAREFDGRIAMFGASTGAAAAMVASAARPNRVRAIVSRGGRPDLAGTALARVHAPTLFLVGSLDELVLQASRGAMRAMRAPVELSVVDGAGHLFEEPGTMHVVVRRAIRFLAAELEATETLPVPA